MVIHLILRDDFNIQENSIVVLFVEIVQVSNKNVLVGVVYRRPGSSLMESFFDNMNDLIDRISNENKIC